MLQVYVIHAGIPRLFSIVSKIAIIWSVKLVPRHCTRLFGMAANSCNARWRKVKKMWVQSKVSIKYFAFCYNCEQNQWFGLYIISNNPNALSQKNKRAPKCGPLSSCLVTHCQPIDTSFNCLIFAMTSFSFKRSVLATSIYKHKQKQVFIKGV